MPTVSPRLWTTAKTIVDKMQRIHEKPKRPSRDGRTNEERLFDSGVFAAAELVRRLTGDEELALAIHEACIFRQKQHQEVKSDPDPQPVIDQSPGDRQLPERDG